MKINLLSQNAYFVQSEAASNRRVFWSESSQKRLMDNEERFVLPIDKDRLWMVFYGVSYKTNGWQNYRNEEWDTGSSPSTCKLAKWFLNDPKDMTIEDKCAFFQDLESIFCHRIELIQRIGSNLIRYVLRVESYEIKELFTKLLELQTIDHPITADQLPQPLYNGHVWIESQQNFSSTYGLFPIK